MRITKDRAVTLALQGLAYLAGKPDELERFLAVSGLAAESLRARASDPGLLAAVLDFLLREDETVLDFCQSQEIEPRILHLARMALEEDD